MSIVIATKNFYIDLDNRKYEDGKHYLSLINKNTSSRLMLTACESSEVNWGLLRAYQTIISKIIKELEENEKPSKLEEIKTV